jgi:hypothetical protein
MRITNESGSQFQSIFTQSIQVPTSKDHLHTFLRCLPAGPLALIIRKKPHRLSPDNRPRAAIAAPPPRRRSAACFSTRSLYGTCLAPTIALSDNPMELEPSRLRREPAQPIDIEAPGALIQEPSSRAGRSPGAAVRKPNPGTRWKPPWAGHRRMSVGSPQSL